MNITNKVAIVTGAGRVDERGNPRIGNAIALALAEHGARILIHYASSKEGAEQTMRTIRESGGDAFAFQADLADERVGEKLVREAQDRFGAPVQILINSAAVFPTDTLSTFDAESAIRTFRIIGVGPTLLMRAMAETLPQNLEGVIINIIDARIGGRPYPDHLTYAMAKAAFSEASTAAALELARRNIRVVRISPGVILQAAGKSAEHHEKVLGTVPLGHEGGTQAITKAIISVIDNDFVTGSNIVIDGGASLR